MSPIERRHAEELRVLSAEHDREVEARIAAETKLAHIARLCSKSEPHYGDATVKAIQAVLNSSPVPL